MDAVLTSVIPYSWRMSELTPLFKRKMYHTGVNRLSIYNSVLTCRQHIINSSASAPPNATKIAVKKVSDVVVYMFGPELSFSMYKCCFLACFCARQRARWLRAELT